MSETVTSAERLVEKNRVVPVWCPGCGDFGVLQSLVRALQELGKTPRDTVLVSGIGCSGRLPYFVDAYGFHTLHGRALPVAQGVKLANPALTVVVIAGDGDGFGIGGGHVPHAARRNVDITYLVLDNAVYALTKGHSSPTTPQGQRTPSARGGEDTVPLDILGTLLAARSSFIASAWSGDRPRLTQTIVDAIRHPGFATVVIQSPCPTFNDDMTFDNLRDTVRPIPKDHRKEDLSAALMLHHGGNGPWDGILYQAPRPTPRQAQIAGSEAEARFRTLVSRYA